MLLLLFHVFTDKFEENDFKIDQHDQQSNRDEEENLIGSFSLEGGKDAIGKKDDSEVEGNIKYEVFFHVYLFFIVVPRTFSRRKKK